MRPALRSWMPVLAVLATLACKTRVDVEPPEPAASSATAAPVRLLVASAPPAGDVASEVREASATAAAEKRRLIVYVGAEWCEPCKRFRAAAESGELDAMFGGLTLFAFDSDRDSERLKAAGYVSRYIPLFALPAADGTASGKQIEGGIKGVRAVAEIAPRLRVLLAQ